MPSDNDHEPVIEDYDTEILHHRALEMERKRLELERERRDWEANKASERKSFFVRNPGVIISAVVSLAAVMVGYLQFSIEQSRAEQELEIENLRSERLWRIEGAKFVADNMDKLFSQSDDEVKNLYFAIELAFPPEIASGLVSSASKKRLVEKISQFVGDNDFYDDFILAAQNRGFLMDGENIWSFIDDPENYPYLKLVAEDMSEKYPIMKDFIVE